MHSARKAGSRDSGSSRVRGVRLQPGVLRGRLTPAPGAPESMHDVRGARLLQADALRRRASGPLPPGDSAPRRPGQRPPHRFQTARRRRHAQARPDGPNRPRRMRDEVLPHSVGARVTQPAMYRLHGLLGAVVEGACQIATRRIALHVPAEAWREMIGEAPKGCSTARPSTSVSHAMAEDSCHPYRFKELDCVVRKIQSDHVGIGRACRHASRSGNPPGASRGPSSTPAARRACLPGGTCSTGDPLPRGSSVCTARGYRTANSLGWPRSCAGRAGRPTTRRSPRNQESRRRVPGAQVAVTAGDLEPRPSQSNAAAAGPIQPFASPRSPQPAPGEFSKALRSSCLPAARRREWRGGR